MNRLYLNDIGVVIRVDTKTNLTGATLTRFIVERPDGTIVNWAASIELPATSGILRYTIVAGDLNLVGKYTLNTYVEFGVGVSLRGTTTFFEVRD